MGATVIISSSQLLNSMAFQLLTNEHGRFSSATLPAGIYSVKVTLAGFLPAVEQDIQVRDEHTTLLEIVLGSVFSSLEKLRRQPDQQVSSDDWSWVLRTSAATRPVLRWQDGDVVFSALAPIRSRSRRISPRARAWNLLPDPITLVPSPILRIRPAARLRMITNWRTSAIF